MNPRRSHSISILLRRSAYLITPLTKDLSRNTSTDIVKSTLRHFLIQQKVACQRNSPDLSYPDVSPPWGCAGLPSENVSAAAGLSRSWGRRAGKRLPGS